MLEFDEARTAEMTDEALRSQRRDWAAATQERDAADQYDEARFAEAQMRLYDAALYTRQRAADERARTNR